jgi:hypothetical protein
MVRNLNPYFALRLQCAINARTGEKEIPMLKFSQNRIKENEL